MATCKEKALEWGISVRSVNDLCKRGKISGAIKVGKSWQIPQDAPKPTDGRVSLTKNETPPNLKTLPIGISDYIRLNHNITMLTKL